MNEATPVTEQVCTDCGATNPITAGNCWLCYRPLGRQMPPTRVAPAAASHNRRSTSHSSTELGLALGMTAIVQGVVLLGAFLLAPGLGIFLALISIPLFLRICSTLSRSPIHGRGATDTSIGFALLIALAAVAAVVTAVAIAMFSACSSFMRGP